MGWVSLFDVDALRALLRMPDGAKPIAVLCVGHVDAFYAKPMLEQERWAARMPIDACLFENGWDDPAAIDAAGSPSSPVDAADAATETGAGSASASTTSVGGSPNASPDGPRRHRSGPCNFTAAKAAESHTVSATRAIPSHAGNNRFGPKHRGFH